MPDIPVDFAVMTSLAIRYGTNMLGALLLAIAGIWLAGAAERTAHRLLLAARHMDVTVAGFLSSLVRYAVLAVALVAILQVIGIQATSLIAVLGAASLAIGLALQGTLSNMAAGVMLLLFRPFRVGDHIEVGGKNGEVRDLTLFFTELSTADNVQVLIPNGSVWGNAMTNFSKYPNRFVETKVTARNGDADATIQDVQAFLSENQRVLSSPPPIVKKVGYGDPIELDVKAWTRAADTDALRYELVRFVTERAKAKEREAAQPAE
ncbi:mechanosensitive ion channel family protein [Hansschlegelia beijingensis]|uniref:mechanosensitive ion channel family protein n=1 Tax=Hansschlegelia beijingensis TaxID=1133344 RepID=UPI00380F81F9